MLYDDLAASLKQKTVDCCWTIIRTNADRRYPFYARPATRKFSAVLRGFNGLIVKRALHIYEKMDAAGAFVPWVRRIEDGIELMYVSDPDKANKIIFSIYEDKTLYVLSSPVDNGHERQLPEDVPTVLFEGFALHVNGAIILMEE